MRIKVNDNFDLEGSIQGWDLIHYQDKERKSDDNQKPKRWKKGDKYRTSEQLYFAKLQTACEHLIDIAASHAPAFESIQFAIKEAGEDCVKAIEEAGLTRRSQLGK